MKNLPHKEVLFSSEAIKILFHKSPVNEKFSRIDMIERQSSFYLLFLLSTNINLEVQDSETNFLFKKNQYILHYSREESITELWTENNDPLIYMHIEIVYDYIFNLINPVSDRESEDILENLTRNNYIFLHKQTPPYMTVEMRMIVKEIISYSKKGMLQKLFIEAKIIKLLMLIFEQFSEKNTVKDAPKIPFMIKKFVDENFHKNIKVEEIGKIIGINQNKIRKEFKAQYHMTVNDYIAELRMLKAKKLIINKEVLIKEIAIECGYEYVQNFTRAFKKKFGISPEKLRNE